MGDAASGAPHRAERIAYLGKKADNLKADVALRDMPYNVSRIRKTPAVTPAMEAGKADYVWSLEEIAGLADQAGPLGSCPGTWRSTSQR